MGSVGDSEQAVRVAIIAILRKNFITTPGRPRVENNLETTGAAQSLTPTEFLGILSEC